MTSTPSMEELRRRRLDLLQSLCLLEFVNPDQLPDALQRLDVDHAKQLTAGLGFEPGFSPNTSRFVVQVLQKSGKGYAACLQSDIELLRKVQETGEEYHNAPLSAPWKASFPSASGARSYTASSRENC